MMWTPGRAPARSSLATLPFTDPTSVRIAPAFIALALSRPVCPIAPTGTHKLTICTCLPCGLQGSLDAADHLKAKLGVDFNETTADGRFTLKEGECMGACAMSPVILVNNKAMHDHMSGDKIDALLKELK